MKHVIYIEIAIPFIRTWEHTQLENEAFIKEMEQWLPSRKQISEGCYRSYNTFAIKLARKYWIDCTENMTAYEHRQSTKFAKVLSFISGE